MRIKDCKDLLRRMFQHPRPMAICLSGPPGTGKTDTPRQVAEELGADYIALHPVLMDESELIGLGFPSADKKSAEHLPFGYLQQMIDASKLTVVSFEDMITARQSVQAACMQLILDRRVQGKKISPFVRFVLTTNRASDKSGGYGGLLEALKLRMAQLIELDVTVADWLEWAESDAGNMPAVLTSFIRWTGAESLFNFKASGNMEMSPCPRTVANVGYLLDMGLPTDETVQYEIFKSACGAAFAAKFSGFLKIYRALPDIQLVLTNPDSVPIPGSADIKFAMCGYYQEKATVHTFANIYKYMKRLGQEFLAFFMQSVIRRKPELSNLPEYQQWVKAFADNQSK